jgi:hypothetical protein
MAGSEVGGQRSEVSGQREGVNAPAKRDRMPNTLAGGSAYAPESRSTA